MAGKKHHREGKRVSCPTCMQKLPKGSDQFAFYLSLNPETGIYSCQGGHTYTMDQLREALATPQDAPADRPEIGDSEISTEAAPVLFAYLGASSSSPLTVSEVGQEENSGLSDKQDKTGDSTENGSSHQPDDLAVSAPERKAALLPNGDMLVTIPIPEAMVGPIVELAQQEGKTTDEWVSAVFGFWLEDYFSVPSR